MLPLITIVSFITFVLFQGQINEVNSLLSGGGNFVQGVGSNFYNSVESFVQLPQDNPDNIRFYFFPNSQNPQEVQEIVLGNISTLENLNYRPNAQWKFLVHGFTQNVNTGFPQNVKNAYLKRMRTTKEEYNIVIVDWGELAYFYNVNIQDAGLPLYDRAVHNVIPTGNRTAELIAFLINNEVIPDLSQVHLIGFSLGSHVIGQAGNWLKSKYSGLRVSRITGLDPAGPGFNLNITSRRLENVDADFVDVYHCNPGALGIDMKIGDVEFYPNLRTKGQLIQPQCPTTSEPEPNTCSHNYCTKFFAWTLLNNIVAERCEDRAMFLGSEQICWNETATYGNDVSHQSSGNYFADITTDLENPALFI